MRASTVQQISNQIGVLGHLGQVKAPWDRYPSLEPLQTGTTVWAHNRLIERQWELKTHAIESTEANTIK